MEAHSTSGRAVAHLHIILGLEPRFLYPYALPASPHHVPGPYEEMLRSLKSETLRGRVLRVLGRKAEALDAFDRALKRAPGDVRALAWRGELKANTEGQFEAGLADLRAAAAAAPKDPWPWIWEGAARLTTSAAPETFAALDGALKRDGRNVCALLLRSTAFARLAKPESALEDAALAAKLAPSCPGAQVALGRLCAKLGRAADAVRAFSAASRLDPDGKNHYGSLVSDGGLSEGPDGLRLLDAYIRKHPKCAWALALRGDFLRSFDYQDMEAGMGDLEKAVRLDPKTPWMRACLARSRVQYKYAEQGIQDLKKAIALDPGCAWLHSWLGESYRRVERFEPAVKSFRRAIALAPRFAQAHMWLGRLYGDRKLWSRALAEFTRAVEVDCDYGFGFAKRGETLARLGRHAEALADFDRALNLQVPFPREWLLNLRSRSRLAAGDCGGAFADLAETVRSDLRRSWVPLQSSGEPADKSAGHEALTGLNEGLSRNPRAGRLMAWRGAVLLGLGRVPEALADFDRAISMRADLPWALGWRGRARWQAGRVEEAAADLEAALALDGASPWLWSWRAELRLGLGDAGNALKDAERALELSRRDAHALFCRGEAFRQLGKKPEARKSLDAAIGADFRLAPAYISRGVLLGEQGDAEGQLRDFHHAARLAPELFRRKLEEAKASGAGPEAERLLQSLLDSASQAKAPSSTNPPKSPSGR